MAKPRYKAQQVIDAITEAKGFVSDAASILGCSRTTVHDYINKYSTVADALDDVREQRHDRVENKLLDAIDQGNIAAIIFYLKTQCKDRGYVERTQQEITGKDGEPQKIVVEYVEAPTPETP
jgi:predicted transcriptional regulator